MDGSAVIKVCGLGLLAAVVSVILRELCKGLALPLKFAGAILTAGAALALFYPTVQKLLTLSAEVPAASGYGTVLLKALGISILAEFSAGICRDVGEGAIASGIETAGKACVLVLALPLIEEALGSAGVLLGWS